MTVFKLVFRSKSDYDLILNKKHLNYINSYEFFLRKEDELGISHSKMSEIIPQIAIGLSFKL